MEAFCDDSYSQFIASTSDQATLLLDSITDEFVGTLALSFPEKAAEIAKCGSEYKNAALGIIGASVSDFVAKRTGSPAGYRFLADQDMEEIFDAWSRTGNDLLGNFSQTIGYHVVKNLMGKCGGPDESYFRSLLEAKDVWDLEGFGLYSSIAHSLMPETVDPSYASGLGSSPVYRVPQSGKT